jgi:hypothetical protein
MSVVVLSRDLILASRILGQASSAGHDTLLVWEPSALPPVGSVDLLFVNWADRAASWAGAIREWSAAAPGSHKPRLLLYGPHADLEAHAAAKAAGLGPMVARSKLVADLPLLIEGPAPARPPLPSRSTSIT